MKEIFYYEMRKRIEEIRALDPKNVESDGVYPVSEKDMMLLDTVSEMIELSRIATKEGLLTLEEKSLEYKNAPAGKYLSHLITLVADCTPPEELEEIAYCRYFSSGLSDYGALQYLIMLYGILAVQRGENAFRLERKIIYLLPEELYQLLEHRAD